MNRRLIASAVLCALASTPAAARVTDFNVSPQSNCPPGRVPAPDHGARLDARKAQGGISRVAPPELAPRLQSLPPILHSPFLAPLRSCSKGS